MEPERSADFARLFVLSSELLATIDRRGAFQTLNPAWHRVLGWSIDELRGRRTADLVHPDDRERTFAIQGGMGAEVYDFENRCAHKRGGWRWLRWRAWSDGEVWFASACDVTESKELERKALADPLTGLPNRLLLNDRLKHALGRLERSGGNVAVIFVDLDRFKVANDTLGHETGDALLRAAAERLSSTVRGSDTVARLGGDEFVIVAEDLSCSGEGCELAQQIVRAFEAPLDLMSESFPLRASAGVALAAAGDRRSPAQLVSEADTAMYRAKGAGRDRYEVFDDYMRAEVAERVSIALELRHALAREELVLVYQPMVGVSDGSLAAREALVRWHHPDRGVVPPLSFIPLAEENGLIVPIGEWVLREACRQAAEWRKQGDQVPVTVNVSPIQLVEPDFAAKVTEACAAAGLPPEQLWLELVETSIVQQGETVLENLRRLRELGVRIALDDFGAGATSLSYFRSLPLDAVKLDRVFMKGLARGSEDRAVVAALVSLAEDMDLMVVAEGVESEDQLAQLRELGCDYAQGFWFARPAPPEEVAVGGFSERDRPDTGDPSAIREFRR